MKSCYNIILVLMYLCISGCAAPQKFYKNTRYTGDIQGHLNNDLAYCHAIAQGLKPTVTPYIPPSPTTTHGSGIITDNHGNVYTGTYRQTTYPNENMALLSGMNNLSRSIQASNIYEAIKTRCLSELGWYEISKEEYLKSQNIQQQIDMQQEIKQKQIEEYNKTFFAKIESAHPDFVSLNKEKQKIIVLDIEEWIKLKPYKEAEKLMTAFKHGNADEVSSLLSQYKKHKKINTFN